MQGVVGSGVCLERPPFWASSPLVRCQAQCPRSGWPAHLTAQHRPVVVGGAVFSSALAAVFLLPPMSFFVSKHLASSSRGLSSIPHLLPCIFSWAVWQEKCSAFLIYAGLIWLQAMTWLLYRRLPHPNRMVESMCGNVPYWHASTKQMCCAGSCWMQYSLCYYWGSPVGCTT